ncbi:Aste57867_25452 [Aphanomyces stellatus]|uniref:Aste57867_25452 protein n=1 Tax=Aphanomyces stellatus TaxID=120398 RepID=A0A485LVM2_9STRA|nr:hypothetical protein As57867_025373 [Aphanomyces stellatus]VFU02075.1 Aste57867_25452 [Aphanomyces stellatus]
MLADYATYTWAKFQVTLTPNCAGDLSIYGYTGASSWYSVVQAAKLDLTNALTASFCGSSDCLALTNTTVAKLPNCKVASGDNLYSTTKSLLAFCPSTSNPYPDDSCDQLLTTANQRMLGPSCNRSTGLLLQPPSLAAVAIDYSNNPNSIFGFGICGDPACTASLTASLASYPTCSAFPAYYWSANSWAVVQPVSYASQLTTLLGSCAEYKVSIGTGNSTCQMADYAAYNWAKYQATLSSNCAASLARFGFNASSLWYAVVQTATLAPSNLLTSAFCGSVDCLQLTSAAASQLPNCSVASGENLFLTATNLLNYCNSTNPIPSPSPTSRPVPPAPYNATIQSLLGLSTNHTCDAIIRAANQWTLSQACGDSIFQGGTPPSLAAIGMDYSSNYYTVFGYGICGTPQCAASLRTHLTSYPSCTPIQATSYYSTLSTLLNSCPRLLNAITSGSNTCMLADYATTNWAKYQATLTPNCAAALAPFGYTTSSLWFTVVQSATLSQSNTLTSFFCGSPCLQLTATMQSALPNCNTMSGENLFSTATNLLAYCQANPMGFPAGSCDQKLLVANQLTLSPTCVNDMQLDGTPPSLAAIAIDYATTGNSVFVNGICGAVSCRTSFAGILTSYPTCTSISALSLNNQIYSNYYYWGQQTSTEPPSYYATLVALQSTCSARATSGTCLAADIAASNWAKYKVTLTPNCAADLTGINGYSSTSTLWYSTVQVATFSQSNTLTTLFCGSAACLQLTLDTIARLRANCAVASGENVYATATTLLQYCAPSAVPALLPLATTPPPPPPPPKATTTTSKVGAPMPVAPPASPGPASPGYVWTPRPDMNASSPTTKTTPTPIAVNATLAPMTLVPTMTSQPNDTTLPTPTPSGVHNSSSAVYTGRAVAFAVALMMLA